MVNQTPVAITRLCRARSYDAQNMVSVEAAMHLCIRHFNRADANYVLVNGKPCFTVYQAEKRINAHFH